MNQPLDLSSLSLGGSTDNSDAPVGTEGSENVNSDSLANPFLQAIPETDRPVVEKYIKDWDGQVTKKFQEIHSQYEPYKQLGDIEQIKQAVQIYQMASTDPVGFYEYIGEILTELKLLDNNMSNDENMDSTGSNPLPEYEGLPEPFVQKFSQLEQTIDKLNKFVETQERTQQESQQQQQLDELFKKLHNDLGDFDDDAVMGRILKGMDPEKAVKDYQGHIEKIIGSRTKRPNPPTLGSGQTPIEQVDSSKLNNKRDRVNAVASILSSLEG